MRLRERRQILFLTHRLPYAPNRGDRIRSFHLLRLLAQHHDVHLVSLVHDEDEERHLADVASRVASARVARVPSLRNRVAAVAALAGNRPLTHVLLSSPSIAAAIRASVAQSPPDLLFAFCTGIADAAFKPPLDRLPCVLDMVDVDSEKWAELADRRRGPMKWIYRREARTLRAFERQAMQRAVVTTVVSDRERAHAERALGRSAVAVPVGVDVGLWTRPPNQITRPEIVFCAVFNYEPNEMGAVWLAQEVWPLVKREVPEAILKLVGMLPSPRVKALAAAGSIEVTGAVADVRPYVWQATAAVAPLWLARGTQTKVLEALAAELPCIVTPAVLGGLPEVVRSACVCCDDAASFAAAIVSCLRDPAQAARRATMRQAVKGLDWDSQLAPFLEIVEKAAADFRAMRG